MGNQSLYCSQYRTIHLCQNQHNQNLQNCLTCQKNRNIVEQASENDKQTIYFRKIHEANMKDSELNWTNLKNRLQQGITIVSNSSNLKYLIHCIYFTNEQQYQNFIDNLLYRIKTIRSCIKTRKYINQILNVYVQKLSIINCTTYHLCGQYKVYVVEKFHQINMFTLFNEEKVSYTQIKNIFHNFCSVMAAYQYKRLRYGKIDFSYIFITQQLEQTPKCRKFSFTSIISNNQSQSKRLSTFLRSTQLKKPEKKSQFRYVCKISDPFVKQYLIKRRNPQIKEQYKMQLNNVYKKDVEGVGQLLKIYLKCRKQSNVNKRQLNRFQNQRQLKVCNQLQRLIDKFMICQQNNRYNWLQIQRLLQEYNNQQVFNRSQNNPSMELRQLNYTPNSTISSQSKQLYPHTSSNKSRSLQKAFTFQNLPNYSSQNHYTQNKITVTKHKKVEEISSSSNKQNNINNNNFYINLKPSKKSDSKELGINSPINWYLNPVNTNMSKQMTPNCMPSSLNYFPQVSNINSITASNLVQPNEVRSIIYTQRQINGYGMIQNQQPQYTPNAKIKYDNLYTIGRTWLRFQGNFVNGFKQGLGTIYFTNGHLFTGHFSKDLANGKGSVFINGQLVLKGTWKNNILITQF